MPDSDVAQAIEPVDTLPFVDARGPVRASKAIAWVGGGVMVAAIAAAWLVRVNVTVRGDLTLVPSSESAPLQSSVAGRVAEVLVHDGDVIHKGDPILRLESDALATTVASLVDELDAVHDRVASLEQLVAERQKLAGLETSVQAEAMRVASAELREVHVAAATARREYERNLKQLRRSQALGASGTVAPADLERAEGEADRAEGEQERLVARVQSRHAETRRAHVARDSAEHLGVAREIETRVDLAEAKERAAALEQELAVARSQLAERTIVSARDGALQGLRVRAVGSVVTAGETVAWVVPSGEPLLADVRVPADAVGFVAPGQHVHMKLDPYPFKDFGTVDGTVTWVSADAEHQDERGAREPYHVARVRIDSIPKDAVGSTLSLEPGMRGVADLVLWRSRVALALLRPFRGTITSVSK
jgi:multidrug efflux pump subunit AcrA (membrane-fusion protein)